MKKKLKPFIREIAFDDEVFDLKGRVDNYKIEGEIYHQFESRMGRYLIRHIRLVAFQIRSLWAEKYEEYGIEAEFLRQHAVAWQVQFSGADKLRAYYIPLSGKFYILPTEAVFFRYLHAPVEKIYPVLRKNGLGFQRLVSMDSPLFMEIGDYVEPQKQVEKNVFRVLGFDDKILNGCSFLDIPRITRMWKAQLAPSFGVLKSCMQMFMQIDPQFAVRFRKMGCDETLLSGEYGWWLELEDETSGCYFPLSSKIFLLETKALQMKPLDRAHVVRFPLASRPGYHRNVYMRDSGFMTVDRLEKD